EPSAAAAAPARRPARHRHPPGVDAQARAAALGHAQRRPRGPLLTAGRLLVALAYLDSSALAKRYLPEVGSAWVAHLCQQEPVAISLVAIPELTSALARRV